MSRFVSNLICSDFDPLLWSICSDVAMRMNDLDNKSNDSRIHHRNVCHVASRRTAILKDYLISVFVVDQDALGHGATASKRLLFLTIPCECDGPAGTDPGLNQ
jgi:hypothetical protein